MPTEQMVSTHKGNKIYLYLLEGSGENLEIPLEKAVKVKKAFFLDGELPIQTKRKKGVLTLSLPEVLPNELANVIVLELDTPASEIEIQSAVLAVD